jgi:hypothetical protein
MRFALERLASEGLFPRGKQALAVEGLEDRASFELGSVEPGWEST